MFKPHVTVACVVTPKQVLVVEDHRWQGAVEPAPQAILEADETLVQAAERELWEETGIRATPRDSHPTAPGDCPGQHAVPAFPVCH
ncbi:NUDIX domain-containing protein [Shigella flexneri]